MRITKIEITNYKSIKEPVEINFYNGLPTVLIGKNGSGKTNILEALSAVAEANGNYFVMRKELPLKYKVHIRLEKEDAERLFPGKSIDEKCEFAACSGEDCKINRIESEYLVPLLRMEIDEISELAGELQDALDTYTKQLNKIAYGENEHPLQGLQIINFKNSTTNYDFLKSRVELVIKEAEKFANSVKQNFAAEESSLKFGYVDYYGLNDSKYLSFKLRYVKPDLAPLLWSYLSFLFDFLQNTLPEVITELFIAGFAESSTNMRKVLVHNVLRKIRRGLISFTASEIEHFCTFLVRKT